MDDLELLERKWPTLIDNLWEYTTNTPHNKSKGFTFDIDGEDFYIHISSEYSGGLEGNYCNVCNIELQVNGDDIADVTMVDIFCCEGDISAEIYEEFMYLFVDKEGESMAKLSERKTSINWELSQTISAADIQNLKGETNMTTNNTGTLRTLNLTLVDNNPNLKVAQKVVFQKLGHMTEHNDERTIQQILMSGEVAEALVKHNDNRVKVVDKAIQRATGRDVKLEEVEIFDLDWQVVRVA